MKKSILISFIALCLLSCKNSNFTISGNVVNNALNGKTIYIKERINREWISIDSTIIENGKFAFNGQSDTAKIAYVYYEYPSNNPIRQAFVLENGKISVSIDTTGFMIFGGSPQNDLLQTYQNDKNAFNIKLESFYRASLASKKTPEQKLVFADQEKKLNQEEVSIDKRFATEHVNTLIGTYVFLNSFYEMSIDEKDNMIKLMNSQTKKVKRIQEIIADTEVERKSSVGCKFIDFKLPGLNGDSIAVSDLVGKTDFVLIDFWASWCGSCMQFLPDLKSFYTKHNGAQFTILGVSLDDDKQAWINSVGAHKMSWKQVSDLKGWKCEGARAYAINSIPATVLINKDGIIVGKNLSLPEMDKLLSEKVVVKQ